MWQWIPQVWPPVRTSPERFRSASSDYPARRKHCHQPKRYLKLSLCVVIRPLVAAAVVVDWGPCNDRVELPQLLVETTRRVRVRRLYADARYDAEWVHCWCRERARIQRWIPCSGLACLGW